MFATSCQIDEYYRSDTMTSAQLKDDPTSAIYTTDGNYSMFKDTKEYRGSEDSGSTYQKMWFHMSEMRGDNAVLSGRTTSPIYNATTLTDNGTLKHQTFFWWIAYKIIYSANTIIESLPEGESESSDHLLGENYFLRAVCHLNLSCLFSTQYSHGREKPGVVLRTSTDCSVTKRATVGEVYDQIVKDLIKAAVLMKNGTPRGDNGYASYEAARGLLTRVYLYREEWGNVIELATDMLGADARGKLDNDLTNLFVNARTSKEVLWCIANTVTDTRGRSSLGSMYYSPNGTGGIGWAELYYSDPLMELFDRYPEDLRYATQFELYGATGEEDKAMVHWPFDQGDGVEWRTNAIAVDVTKNAEGKWAFNYQGADYVVESKDKNGDGYPENYIKGNPEGADVDKDGEVKVYVRPNTDKVSGIRQNFPLYMMKKFSNQDGDSNLSSPIMIRWGEVILNLAEAYAMDGQDANALKYVNVIRNRAGIPEWNDGNKWNEHGYTQVIEVVNDERRMELCFEAHRPYDVIRQKRNIDRRFAGVHTWEIVKWDDPRLLYRIPYDETNVSNIDQNP